MLVIDAENCQKLINLLYFNLVLIHNESTRKNDRTA